MLEASILCEYNVACYLSKIFLHGVESIYVTLRMSEYSSHSETIPTGILRFFKRKACLDKEISILVSAYLLRQEMSEHLRITDSYSPI